MMKRQIFQDGCIKLAFEIQHCRRPRISRLLRMAGLPLLIYLCGCSCADSARSIRTRSQTRATAGRWTMDDYMKSHQSAAETLPYAVEIEQLYPDSIRHFITYFGLRGRPLTWNSEAFFGGKYRLTMQVEVAVDYESHVVRAVEEPIFYLSHIASVTKGPNGQYGARFGETIQFDRSGWDSLYSSGGDLSVLEPYRNRAPVSGSTGARPAMRANPPPRTQKPSPALFNEFVNAVQEPRPAITLTP